MLGMLNHRPGVLNFSPIFEECERMNIDLVYKQVIEKEKENQPDGYGGHFRQWLYD